jgi:hypothetical protein
MAQNNVEHAHAGEHMVSLIFALDRACMVALEVGDLATTERYVAMLLERSATLALGVYQAFGHSLEGELLIKRGDVAAGVRRLRAAPRGLVLGTALRHKPRPTVARSGSERGGARAFGAGLRSVHRGLRDR